MGKLHTYNVELACTYTINARDEYEAAEKARMRAEWNDFSDYVEEITYDPGFDDEET